jgi:hypothetical protein
MRIFCKSMCSCISFLYWSYIEFNVKYMHAPYLKNQWRVLRQILPGAWFISNFLAVQCLEWPSVTDWCILMLVAPSVDSLQGWKTNYIPAQLRSKCCSICGVAPVKPSEFWVLKMICIYIYILFFKYNYILHIIHILRKPAEGLGWV